MKAEAVAARAAEERAAEARAAERTETGEMVAAAVEDRLTNNCASPCIGG